MTRRGGSGGDAAPGTTSAQPLAIGVLLIASIAAAFALEAIGLPAGLLLGPMAVAAAAAANGRSVRVPGFLTIASQAVVGLLIAPSLSASVAGSVLHQPALFVGATLVTIGASMASGLCLARLRVLPGDVAIWGSMPGAATAMVLMAKDEGADWQLVALMSYLRVTCVAIIASLLAAVALGHGAAHPPGHGWFPTLNPRGLLETAAVAAGGIGLGRLFRFPAAPLLGVMFLGAALEMAGLVHPQLPGWLLAPAYLLVGWRIGAGFTPAVFRAARRAAPRVAIALAGLLGFCAGCGWLLQLISGRDLLTCYLATSPGGADSVAIIASATRVDVPFVMAMQVTRFVVVLLIAAPLARSVRAVFGSWSRGS